VTESGGERAGRVPRYKHQLIAADILSRIQSGEWRKGTKLPSIDELEQTYEYSRMTIFKAIQELARQGYLKAERGVGTFVARERLGGRIGLVVSDDVLNPQRTPWAPMFSRQLRAFFERVDYSFKIYIEESSESPAAAGGFNEELAEDLRGRRLTGLVTAHCNAPQYLPTWKEWAQASVPLVDVSSYRTIPHRVEFDKASVIEIWLRLCAGNERVRPAALFSAEPEYALAQATQRGFVTCPEWYPVNVVTQEVERVGYQAMLDLWRHAEKPDALLVGDDIAAKGVVQAIVELGVTVPDDLLVAAVASRDSGVFYPIELAMIEFDTAECARLAAEMLLDLIHDSDMSPRTEVLKPCLRMADGLRIV
jgi:DNA-binding LacI/PurR family transcriptional regulator